MAGITTIAHDLEDIQSTGDFLARCKETYASIPASTKKALAQKYITKLEGFADGKALEYPTEQQAIDHQRVIPLPAALNALQDLEAELVRTQVVDLGDILWRKYKSARLLYEALKVSWLDFWKLVRGLWDYLTGPSPDQLVAALEELWAGVAVCVSLFASIISAKAFVKVALSVIHSRNQCIAILRKKALPQPPAKRYRRRKRAR